MTIEMLNELEDEELYETFEKCCGASNWIIGMMNARPISSITQLQNKADEIWSQMNITDGYEAFTHHPKIGDKKNLEEKFASTKDWAGNEQSGVDDAKKDVLSDLATANEKYFKKYGYIFIVCATGKSAKEMLDIIHQRMNNNPDDEIKIAMGEQHKITKLRLEKLLS